jgi:hypothetical protein
MWKQYLKLIIGILLVLAIFNGFSNSSGAEATGFNAYTIIAPIVGIFLIYSAYKGFKKK